MWPGTAGWRRSAFKCGPRDRWTRWSREWRFQRLHLIGNNTRFVLFGAPGVFPNLTSHALSRMTRRPGDDRRERWGHGLLVAEGFVDPGRFDGGMYRAAGQTACADRTDASAGNTCVVHFDTVACASFSSTTRPGC